MSHAWLHFERRISAVEIDALTRAATAMVLLELGGIASKRALLARTQDSMGLPTWAAANWDALGEAINERFDELSEGPICVLLRDATSVWTGHPLTMGVFLEMWGGLVDDLGDRDLAMHVVVELDDDDAVRLGEDS